MSKEQTGAAGERKHHKWIVDYSGTWTGEYQFEETNWQSPIQEQVTKLIKHPQTTANWSSKGKSTIDWS